MRYELHLAAHRNRRGLRQSDVAEMLGVEQATYQRWEVGKRKPDVEQISALAEAFGVLPGDLFRIPDVVPLGPKLFIKGEVAAGVWNEAYEWAPPDWIEFTGRSGVTAPIEMRFGLRVVGESMNIRYPHGTIVECVSVFGGAEISSGKRVVVLRRREDLEYETTVKQYQVDDQGREWLVPQSTHPEFQKPFLVTEPEPGIIEQRIIAIVVGSRQDED
jgi:transcriptional regulator with XRE-family HTH domain